MEYNKTVLAALVVVTGAGAQSTVKHIQIPNGAIASAVWAGDTLYVSGQLDAALCKWQPLAISGPLVEIEMVAVKPK